MKNRFKATEITYSRLKNAFFRRLASFPEKFSWEFSGQSKKNKKKLLKFKNIHKGKRCFLIANGPSLKQMDLNLLKSEFTFGMNRIYLMSDKIEYDLSYYISVNKTLINQFSDEIKELSMPKFINWETRDKFEQDSTINYIYKSFLGKEFGKDLPSSINPAATVTYAALQVIYYMGFREVIIIGMDHNFTYSGGVNELQKRSEKEDSNHFHPDYFPKGSKWETPDLISSEYYYAIARQNFESEGRRIIDCTINGNCDVFEKGNFLDLI